jgi:hypothetical protein
MPVLDCVVRAQCAREFIFQSKRNLSFNRSTVTLRACWRENMTCPPPTVILAPPLRSLTEALRRLSELPQQHRRSLPAQ